MKKMSFSMFALILITCLCLSCNQTAIKEPPPISKTSVTGFPKIGTKIVYKITNSVTQIRSYTVIDDGIFNGKPVHRVAHDGENKTWLYDKQSKNWIGEFKNGKEIVRADPHDGFISFPLYVGKKYRPQYYWTSKRWSGDVSHYAKVKSFGRISVPAGNFEAFEISVDNERMKYTYWYSPKLNWFVKSIRKRQPGKTTVRELIEFKSP